MYICIVIISSLDKIKTRLTSEMEQLNKERKLSHIEWANRLRSISQEYEDYRVKYVYHFNWFNIAVGTSSSCWLSRGCRTVANLFRSAIRR